jgi:4a-hydroxytetrahydrobiopterin dehydratase
MAQDRAKELLRQLDEGWLLNAEGHLEREYRLKDITLAMALANKVADIAEAQSHHPDLSVAWGKCKMEIWTHKIRGLTESDSYFAAKADRAFSAMDVS